MIEPKDNLDNLYNHPLLNKLIDDLKINQFCKKFNLAGISIPSGTLRKGIWLTSILAASSNEKHKTKAQLAASLFYLQNTSDIDIERVCYVLFSRIGNLTGTRLFNSSRSGNDFIRINLDDRLIDAYDSSMAFELAAERGNKSIPIGKEIILATTFQKQLWNDLKGSKRLVVSAPTSAGKSFIVKKFIKEQLIHLDSFIVLYIVPSRALLNQVSEELRIEMDTHDVDIKTVFIPNDELSLPKRILILTPERCLRLLKERWRNDFSLDFIFIDEIQNVEDTQGRGGLFEFVFKELNNLFASAAIIAAGPNIENATLLYQSVFGEKATCSETEVSPVFQIKTIVTPLKDKRIRFTIKNHDQRSQSVEIEVLIDLRQLFAKSIGHGLRELINLCGKNEQNIIYSPKGYLAENWALKFVEFLEEREVDPFIKEIVDYLEDEIHPSYNLISCLKKGAAFHHGNLPDIVRKEIEDCFLEGRIKNLFCTSTLLQGVNLPANNIFIPSARKKHYPLSLFDFGNLIGRAGRIKDTLYGTIYCIEKSEDNQWSETYYESSPRKEVITASDHALDHFDDFVSELSKSSLEIDSESDSNAVVFYRQKYLQEPELFSNYLTDKGLSEEESSLVSERVSTSVKSLIIPHDIVRLNPTIDPILQNKLYSLILEYGIENWLIPSVVHNPNFYRHIPIEEQALLAFKDWSFYLQFNDLLRRLDEVFHLSNEAYFKHNVSVSIGQISYYARDWIKNKSLSQMIDADIRFYITHSNLSKRIEKDDVSAVNDRISQVIKINSTVTTHLVVKYFKLMNDIIENMVDESIHEKYKFSFALPIMLELGTTEPVVISLISKGISRSIALKIFSEFKKVYGYQDLDVFKWLATKNELKLKPIYNRYLKRMRLLRDEL